MINKWILNKKYFINNKTTNNKFEYFGDKYFNDLNNIIDDVKKTNLKKSCDIWIKNCKNRTVFILTYLLIFAIILLIGVCFLIVGIFILKHRDILFSSGASLIIIMVVITFILYFADNWKNPFMYEWYLIFLELKPYFLKDIDKLPKSIFFIYINNYDENKGNYFLDELKKNNFSKKFIKYVKEQVESEPANYYQDIKNKDVNLTIKSYLDYWGDINAIYEWANFLNTFLVYIKINNKIK